MVPIKKNLVSKDKYGIKCPYPMNPKYVVIHNTANDASAEEEIAYMIRNNNEVSFHYAVDDKVIVQGLPEDRNAWHCGDGGNGDGNRNGIAIEICYSKSGGDRFDKAEKNAAELAAHLLTQYKMPISNLKTHRDFNGKYCPHRTLDKGWDRFVKMVKDNTWQKDAGASAPPKPTVPPKPTATYRVRAAGVWYDPVTELTDYAGVFGSPISDVAIKVSAGSVKYRVHIRGGSWLPYVTGYNINEPNNGYAGDGKPIDAVEVYYTTPKGQIDRKAKYRVAPLNGDYFPWQYDAEKGGGQDGYAGLFGQRIDRFQLTIY